VFATVSAADSWQLKYQMCSTDKTAEPNIERWAELVRRLAINAVLHPAGYKNGLFLDSCRHHTRCWNQIKIDGLTAAGAFEQWYKHWDRVDRKRLWVQVRGDPRQSGMPAAERFTTHHSAVSHAHCVECRLATGSRCSRRA
jgi:hypothetical protein